MVTWHRTEASTTPAMIEMADTDRRVLSIDAGETIESVSAEIVDYNEPETAITGLIESATLNGTSDGALVAISGLTRGTLYELSTIFTNSAGETWTRTTAIDCVA